MNLTHLRYIVEVARTGSITKAAQNLYMGQPNLSRSIKELEKSVSAAIFMRTPKGVVPTKKGEEIIRYARSIVQQADEFDERFLEGSTEVKSLTVAVCGVGYCFSAFERFAAQYEYEQEFSMSYRLCDRESVFSLVESGEADIGAVRFREEETEDGFEEYKGFKLQLIGRGEEKILVSAGSPLLSPNEKDEELSQLLEKCTEVALFGESGGSKKIIAYDLNSGCRLVSALKNGFMRISAPDSDIPKGFSIIKSDTDRIYCDYMVYSEDNKLNSVEREFFRCLREEL